MDHLSHGSSGKLDGVARFDDVAATPDDDPQLGGDSWRQAHRHRRWQRDGGQEFDRVAFFSDAVYAIALTLLALDLRIDDLPSPDDSPIVMLRALDDLLPKLVAYFVGFLLLARYWAAHHSFFGRLKAIDNRLLTINLAYLGFVALLPFPTSLIGEYEQNPISVMLFALNLAAISGIETVMLWQAYRRDLLLDAALPAGRRWEIRCSLTPAIVFVVTIPLAFINPTVQLLSWIPLGIITGWFEKRAEPTNAFPVHRANRD